MTDSLTVSIFVKLKYWDVYRLNVVLMTIIFRKILYIWGTVAVVWVALDFSLLVHPRPDKDWAIMMQNTNSLAWVLGIPLVFIFLSPLLSIPRILRQPRIKDGIRYRFSEAGLHIETYDSTSDVLWKAIQRVLETHSMFMVFTSPNIPFSLPKWCFESQQDVAALRDLFRAQVKTVKLRSD